MMWVVDRISQSVSHLCVVEGHLGEDVVADVGVGDVVEGVVEEEAEGAVDRAERAAEPAPLLYGGGSGWSVGWWCA